MDVQYLDFLFEQGWKDSNLTITITIGTDACQGKAFFDLFL